VVAEKAVVETGTTVAVEEANHRRVLQTAGIFFHISEERKCLRSLKWDLEGIYVMWAKKRKTKKEEATKRKKRKAKRKKRKPKKKRESQRCMTQGESV